MNLSAAADDAIPPEKQRLRFELLFASILLAVGLFPLPALIYGVGILLLGPYGENAGLAAFYGDFFGDLAEPSGRAWAITLGPLVLINLLRLVFFNWRRPSSDDSAIAAQHEAPPSPAESARVEPRISLD